MGTLVSPTPFQAWQGILPGCRRAEKQLPKELSKEPGREAAPAGALAEAAEVAGELVQEQCLGLRQGWRGQQGSGLLATLLQAWGLCSREETGGKSIWEVREAEGKQEKLVWEDSCEPCTHQDTCHEL